MTQLEYYTAILRCAALIGAYGLGVVAITGFAVLTYYLYPFVKK